MKIAFITTQINIKTGGGSNISPHLKAAAMLSLGHGTDILTMFPEKNAFLEKPPYGVIESPTRFKNWALLQVKIFFTLKKYEKNYDVFAFEGEQFIWGAGLYRLLGGKNPVLMHLNGPIFSIYEHGASYKAASLPEKSLKTKISSWLRKTFEKNIGVRWANHIDIFTADSPIIKQWHEEFGFRSGKITVLPAFVDLKQFSEKPNEECEVPENKINLLYVGRLVPEKGVDTLLAAIKELPERKKVLLHIVGNGRQKEELIGLSKKYGTDDSVIFHPWSDKDTLNRLYHYSDIFVHPARWAEPLGLTVIEAMAAGLPVIVPKVSGSAWAAGDGGLTFENGNSSDLRNKISALINDAGLRKKLAENAGKRSRQFDYRNSVKTLESLLSGIINSNKYGKLN